MALPPAKKTGQRFRTPDSSIETLQDRLLKSLSTAFDPAAAAKSDDFFLAQDYSVSNYSESASDPFTTEKNPYKALVDRTKNFVEKAQAERPVRAKTAAAAVSTKKSDTFLTNVELEGNKRRKVVEAPIEEEEVDDGLPQITYSDTLGSANKMEQLDDLEELRKMIRQTKKEMGDYGKELLCLRRDILDATDIASKAGFGVSQDLLRNIENTVNSLNNKNVYQHLMKNEGKGKLSKTLQPITEEEVKKKDSAAPASFIVSKKSFGTGARPSTYKGGLRK